MQGVYRAIIEFDNVVIASPIHYSQLTGPLLSLASRFQCYYAARKFRGSPVELKRKNGGLILVGGGNEIPACRDASAISGTHELADKLNRLQE